MAIYEDGRLGTEIYGLQQPGIQQEQLRKATAIREGKRNWVMSVLGLMGLVGGVTTMGIGAATMAGGGLMANQFGAATALGGAGIAAVGGVAAYEGYKEIEKSDPRYDKNRVKDLENVAYSENYRV